MKIKLKRLWNGLASVRDNVVKDAIKKGDSIVLSVEGMTGAMTLTPERMRAEGFQAVGEDFESKYVSGMKYKLIDFSWKPDKETQ